MASFVVRTMADLDAALTLAPERFRAAKLGSGSRAGVPLGELVVERRETVDARKTAGAIVLDTSHAKDGLLDVASLRRAAAAPGEGAAAASAKKRVRAGDLLVSRLRPYLRQIAVAHPAALVACGGRPLVCSTEFYVLRPADDGASVSFLLGFLLGAHAQEVLAAGQEGGHHPRVPRETLMALRVPRALVAGRRAEGAAIDRALAALYAAHDVYAEVVANGSRRRFSD